MNKISKITLIDFDLTILLNYNRNCSGSISTNAAEVLLFHVLEYLQLFITPFTLIVTLLYVFLSVCLFWCVCVLGFFNLKFHRSSSVYLICGRILN